MARWWTKPPIIVAVLGVLAVIITALLLRTPPSQLSLPPVPPPPPGQPWWQQPPVIAAVIAAIVTLVVALLSLARAQSKPPIIIAVLGVLAVIITALLPRTTITQHTSGSGSPAIGSAGRDVTIAQPPLLPPSRQSPETQPSPPSPPPTPPLPPAIPAVIDEILQALELGNLAFNSPMRLQRGRSSVIHLILSATDSVEKLKDLITATGEREGFRIRISDQMEARLTGMGFKIEAITPQVQGVSKTNITIWKWEIEPTKLGNQTLHLTLSAHLDVKGRQTPRVIQTFERTIEVYVEWPQKVFDFASNNWQWLWTAILIPIGGWILRKYKKREMVDVC